MTRPEKNTISSFNADEERVMLVLAWAERSMTLTELSASLETSADDLRAAMRSLYRRQFLLISRGIGQIRDTYLLSKPAREYVRRHLLPETPSKLPIETLTAAGKRP